MDHETKAPGRPEPSREGLPADYHGPSPDTLRNALERYDDGRVLHHLPPGDGLHRVAWMQFPHRDHWTVDLYCECSIAGIIRPSGATAAFRRTGCPYVPLAAYLRALQLQPTVGPAEPATLRRLLDRAHAGEWLGQQHGGDMWGSNLYLQTVSTLLDLPMPWALADRAVAQHLIGLDGSVLCEPLPERVRPAGPITDWETGEPSEPGWVIWCTRIDNRYLAEVVADHDNRDRGTLIIYEHAGDDQLVHEEAIHVSHAAAFGVDLDDVNLWEAIARSWLKERRHDESSLGRAAALPSGRSEELAIPSVDGRHDDGAMPLVTMFRSTNTYAFIGTQPSDASSGRWLRGVLDSESLDGHAGEPNSPHWESWEGREVQAFIARTEEQPSHVRWESWCLTAALAEELVGE